jgi:hypothetical protein
MMNIWQHFILLTTLALTNCSLLLRLHLSHPVRYSHLSKLPLETSSSTWYCTQSTFLRVVAHLPKASCLYQEMSCNIQCTCPCRHVVTRDTYQRHLQGLGTASVQLAQQRKIYEMRHLCLRHQALTSALASNNRPGSSANRLESVIPQHTPLPDISDTQMHEECEYTHNTAINTTSLLNVTDAPESPTATTTFSPTMCRTYMILISI